MVYISYQKFVTTPLITSMETDSHRTTNLDFPGMEIKLFPRIFMCACNLFLKIYLIFDSSRNCLFLCMYFCFIVDKTFMIYLMLGLFIF